MELPEAVCAARPAELAQFTRDETATAVRRLSAGKAPDEVELTAEMMTWAGAGSSDAALNTNMTRMLEMLAEGLTAYCGGMAPASKAVLRAVLVPKKVVVTGPKDLRSISVLGCLPKLSAHALVARLRKIDAEWCARSGGPGARHVFEHCLPGWCPGRSAWEVVLCLQTLGVRATAHKNSFG